ncbi:MAG: chemotaxis protein CheW [Acidobacteriota bacterium]|nr:chemotaxis protein CheW [Acidobacteriota bacterium]
MRGAFNLRSTADRRRERPSLLSVEFTMNNAENNQTEMVDLLDMPDLHDMPDLGDVPEGAFALDLTTSAEIPTHTIGDMKAKPTIAVGGNAIGTLDDTDDFFDSLLAEMKMKTNDSFSPGGDDSLSPFGFEGDKLPVISPHDDLDSLIGVLEAETPHTLSPPDNTTVELDHQPINLPTAFDSLPAAFDSDSDGVARPDDLPDVEFVASETSDQPNLYQPMVSYEDESEAVAFTGNEEPSLDAFDSVSTIAENDLDSFAGMPEFQPLEVAGEMVDVESPDIVTVESTPPDLLDFAGVEQAALEDAAPQQAETTAQSFAPEGSIDSETVVHSAHQEAKAIVDRHYDTLDSLIAQIDEEVAAHPLTLRGDVDAASSTLSTSIGAATEHHVIFTLNNTAYSLPVGSVLEISTPLAVTPLPNVPVWVQGIANLRGDIISVVDLRQFFQMEGKESSRSNRMLVVRSPHGDITSGLIVDGVREISYLKTEQITRPTAPIESGVAPYMRGVYEHKEHLLVLLDPERLMLSSEMRQFEMAE